MRRAPRRRAAVDVDEHGSGYHPLALLGVGACGVIILGLCLILAVAGEM